MVTPIEYVVRYVQLCDVGRRRSHFGKMTWGFLWDLLQFFSVTRYGA